MMQPDPERPNDYTDYQRRQRVNIVVAITMVVLLGLLIWSVRALMENERLQACYATGRRDCEPLKIPPADGPVQPAR